MGKENVNTVEKRVIIKTIAEKIKNQRAAHG